MVWTPGKGASELREGCAWTPGSPPAFFQQSMGCDFSSRSIMLRLHLLHRSVRAPQ